jgi:Rieske Fe-S protein
VKFNPESGKIECPCHAGFFNALDGTVISGPPPKALTALPTFVQEKTLFLGSQA